MPRKPKIGKPAVPAGMQRCAGCDAIKPLAAFRALAGGGRQAVCRACRPALPVPGWQQRAEAARARRRVSRPVPAQVGP